jgi:hypothetical protein
MKFVAELPPGYDERTTMALTGDNRIVIAHPEHPPMILDEKSCAFVPIVISLSGC